MKAERLWETHFPELPSLVGNFEFSLQMEFATGGHAFAAARLPSEAVGVVGIFMIKRFGRLAAEDGGVIYSS